MSRYKDKKTGEIVTITLAVKPSSHMNLMLQGMYVLEKDGSNTLICDTERNNYELIKETIK